MRKNKKKKAKNYEKMIRIAEQLSENLVHMRVDLYNIDGQIYFGELTFFDQGGFDADITLETDLKWENSWIWRRSNKAYLGKFTVWREIRIWR